MCQIIRANVFQVGTRIPSLSSPTHPAAQSPIIHHTLLRGLTPGQTYFYRVGECFGAACHKHGAGSFEAWPHAACMDAWDLSAAQQVGGEPLG